MQLFFGGAAKLKRAVFFDFDGTLAHTAPDMVSALHGWQQAQNQKPLDYETARMHVSGGARALLAAAGIDSAAPEYETARMDFLARYEAGGYRRTFLFAGIKKTLSALAADGWLWGVATNKPRHYFGIIAANLGLETNPEIQLPPAAPPLAAALVAGDDCRRAKPNPEPLLLAAKIAGVAPENCIYVGDDVRDSVAARAAGMQFIAACWGYWPAAEWAKCPAALALASAPECIPPLAAMRACGQNHIPARNGL